MISRVDDLPVYYECSTSWLKWLSSWRAPTGYADAWPLLADYPRATYAVLDRAGHDLPVDDDGLYQALVRDWLKRMEKHPGA